jgi:diaminohydroxyphosphoribosylaminopyrimidine deaminase/5-amino-6-(5-phosphoribosylamino)uracil reductase
MGYNVPIIQNYTLANDRICNTRGFDYFRAMTTDESYMLRCIELARMGAGAVSPNPMVGCVIVHNNRIIGEGWHRQYGGPHAEVNAVNSVADKSLLPQSTVYVNLEPCSHFGKTPPCADLLIAHRVQRVVTGMTDPFSEVSGRGIGKLRAAGITVETGVLQQECEELNKRFITFHRLKRPYIILKWAQTLDGFIAPDAASMTTDEFEQRRHITGRVVQKLVHKWRAEEDAVLVGTHTALSDDPVLNVRAYEGRNPMRITLDKSGRLPAHLRLFDGSQRTLVFTALQRESLVPGLEYIAIDFTAPIWPRIAHELHQRNIQSLVVEGGTVTLHNIFISGIWDEAQVFTSPSVMGAGVAAPAIHGKLSGQFGIDGKQLHIYRHS